MQFATYGINAAQYATELMEFSSAALKDGIASETQIPNDVAQRAATALRHAESQAAAYGASTVAVLCQQGGEPMPVALRTHVYIYNIYSFMIYMVYDRSIYCLLIIYMKDFLTWT